MKQDNDKEIDSLSPVEKMLLSNQIRIIGILAILNTDKFRIKEIKEIVKESHDEIREKLGIGEKEVNKE